MNSRGWTAPLGATPCVAGRSPGHRSRAQNFVASARQRVSKSLQALGYYRPAIDIEINREQPQWRMTIQVDAGQPVRIREFDMRIDGAAGSDPVFEKLLADPGVASGDVLHHGNYEKLRNRLLSLAQQRGYFDAAISRSRVAVDATTGTADIALHLDSGRRFAFGDLRFDETLVSTELLEALRTFQPGEPYDRNQLRAFQDQLQRTGYFSAVLVEPVRSEAAAGRIPVDVSLHPAKRHSIDAGIGYSTDTEGRLSLAWRTPRVNRFGHSQQTRLVYSAVNPSGRINYTIPLTHPLDDLLQLWARLEENEFGDLDSEQRESAGAANGAGTTG
ncbi:MAG: POTRA domain-containing protein [Halioglobus sp.]|nr:POTRA domain-containing protein [Halioglobus sp.]